MGRIGAIVVICVVARAAAAEEIEAQLRRVVAPAWLLNDDFADAGPGQAIHSSRLAFSRAGGEGWPVGKLPLAAGAAQETVTQHGFGRGVSLMVSGLTGDHATGASGARIGVRWAAGALLGTKLTVSGGVVQQLDGQNGAWGTAALERAIGLVRVTTSVVAEHAFSAASDAVDVRLAGGADVAIGHGFRAGLEYAVRDLEEAGTGGANQVVGAVLSTRLLRDSLAISAGPGLALTAAGARPVGRLAALWSF